MNLQSLPSDVNRYLFGFLSSKIRAGICSVSKLFETVSLEVSKRLSLTPELYHWNRLHIVPKKKCEEISALDYHLMVRLKQFNKIDFSAICKGLDIDVIRLFIDHAGNIRKKSDGLTYVAKSGRTDIFKILLPSFDWSDDAIPNAIEAASKSGNMEILKMILESDQYDDDTQLLRAIAAASKHGHISVVEYLRDQYGGLITTEMCLMGAAKGGQMAIIELECDSYKKLYGEDIDERHLNNTLFWACKYNQSNVINHMIKLGATYCDNCGATNH